MINPPVNGGDDGSASPGNKDPGSEPRGGVDGETQETSQAVAALLMVAALTEAAQMVAVS